MFRSRIQALARINIEDSLWSDPRFQQLLIKTGSRHTAKGMVLELWTLAQKHWLSSEGEGIPRSAWDALDMPFELIECKLAKECGDYVYAAGSKEQFAWLDSCSKKGKKGGPAAAKERHENKGKSRRQKTSEDVTASSQDDTARALTPTHTTTPTPIHDSFFSKDTIANATGYPEASPGIKSPIGFFIANYVNSYQQKYGFTARPNISGKIQGQIKRFVAETPIERAIELIQTYCSMDDPWFLTKAHDFGTFIENLSKVGLKLDTGTTHVRNQAEERSNSNKELMRRVLDGDL